MASTPPPNMFDPTRLKPAWQGRAWLIGGVAAAMLVAGGVGGAVGAGIMQARIGTSSAIPLPGTSGGTPSSFADVAQRVTPAVVSVHVTMRRPGGNLQANVDGPLGEFFRRFGESRAAPPPEAAGSGFFISADGFIVTNNHVIENGETLSVSLEDGRTLPARLVGRDPRTDLAVLKVEGSDFPFVGFAENEPRIGDWVLAVGNPFGLGGTVTSGIVSARGRDIGAGPYDDFLQIDAPVNQGNSGGPAFNLAGQVVGVNTAIYSPSGGNVGIAFAIPAGTAQPIVDSLRRSGSVSRGYLGVAAQPVTEDIARSMNLRNQRGALVAEVTEGSPAARAGIQPGDVITRINDREVSDARALARIVGGVEPGANAEVTYVRDGQSRTARVALGTQPPVGQEGPDAGQPQGPQTGPGGKPNAPQGGGQQAEAGNASLGIATAPAGGQGVVVVGVDPSGPAASRGVGVGDLILEAGGRAVNDPGDLEAAVTEARRVGRGVVLLRVQSQQGAGYIAVPIASGRG